MIGPTDLLHPSPAPHFKTFQLFLMMMMMMMMMVMMPIKNKNGICKFNEERELLFSTAV
jgi:hypothetical protein